MPTTPSPPNPVWRGLIWLLSAGAICVVALLAWFLYEAAYSPDARLARSRNADAAALAQEAAQAPGTRELRAAGCSEAFVLDLGRARELGIAPGDTRAGTVILCRAPRALDCAELARAYAGAVAPAPERVFVSVRMPGLQPEACSGTIDVRR